MDEKLKEVVDSLIEKTEALNKESSEEIKNQLNLEIAELKNSLTELESKMKKSELPKYKSFRNALTEALNSDEYKKIVNMSAGRKDFSFELPIMKNEIKYPDSFTDGKAPVTLPFREMGVGKEPRRPLMVSDIIQWGTTSSNMVDWIERDQKTDAAAMRAEGGLMQEGDVSYIEKHTMVKIASEYMKVTNESLKDVDFLASEINSELLEDIRILIDNQLLNGDGTGNNLSGIIPFADPFNAGSFAGQVEEANEADVLRVAINQIHVAGQGTWMPNYILMHPTDLAKLDLLKVTDGQYIEVPFYDGSTVVRVPIISNVGIGEGNYLVGDFSRAKAFLRDGLTIRVWDQNDDDPLYNRSTVTGNIRLAFRIKDTDKGAFVVGNFATDKAALETP